MPAQTLPQVQQSDDPLGDYVARAARLRAKLALIAVHQRESAASLSRAAAHLRAMAQCSPRPQHLENRKLSLSSENLAPAAT